jgi:Protein of unknown function (DUF3307)
VLLFLLFFLFAGHALMDFALQGDAIAICKCRKANHPLQKSVPWYYWMSAHAILHGAMVGAIVRWAGYEPYTAAMYGLIETIIHLFVDAFKCEGYTNIHQDQAIHLICKMAWSLMLIKGVTFL